MKITRKRNLLNGAGIFAGSLTVAAIAVYFYSPVIGSHADTTTIGAEVNAMIALTTPENLRLEVTPSAAGATASDLITATVNTNSSYGYELYFSATDTDTSMTSETSSSTITSDFTTTSLANIPVNSWGYSLDDTDYSPIPTSENSTRIKSVEHLPTGNELATSIYFGTKVSTSLASGLYSDNVLFSAIAIAPPPPPTMQTFNATTMLPNTGDSMELEDERDGTMYIVKRLADGNVWMTENLRLIKETISSADSNLPSGETYTVPASDVSAFTTDYNTDAAYLDSTYGGYYNFYTATAGWGTDSVTSGNSPKDICPKGWRLPTGGSSGEFQTLYNNYNSSTLLQGEPNFTLSGRVFNGSVSNQGSVGNFWSSTVPGANLAYLLNLDSSNVYPARSYDKYLGFSVRCVAKKPTMQTFESSMLQNVGDSMQLEDERDGNVYTVKRLADDNVWMTENLRIINKTISSSDSNLPSGETYTVPASDISSFTTSYDTNSAYLDSAYGGYYNFYTATAGWGTNSVTSGDSPKDICPKGWRLPTSGDTGEFQALYNNYNSSTLMQGEPNFTLSGRVANGSVYYQGSYGRFWSSMVSSASNAYYLNLNSSGVYPANGSNKSNGFSVRCIAKEPT